jgi:hypothetical protein
MAQLTRYGRKALLDHALGIAAFTMPASTHLALFATDPTEAGLTSGELSGGGYSRKALAGNMAATNLATGQAVNNGLMVFGPATAVWGAVAYFGVLDAASGGNMIFYGPLVTAMTVQVGDGLPVSEASLSFSLS